MEYPPPREDSLDDLIGAIYDCVIDPMRWSDTVDRIRRRYGFFNGVLGVNGPATNEIILDIVVNIPEPMLSVMRRAKSEDVIRMWGGWPLIAAVPLEEPIRQSDVRPPDWQESDYFDDFIKPQDIVDSVVIVLVRDSRTVANISFGVHRSGPVLEEAILDELRVLAPHLRRAVTIGRMLENAMATTSTFAEALDAAAAGVVLVDAGRDVVHANRAAAAMLAAGDPIRTAAGQLELTHELVAGSLQRAIDTASGANADSTGTGVPARRADGQPLTVQVMPLGRRTGFGAPRAAAAVFVSEAVSGPASSSEILGVLFNLTPAEARLFGLLAQGRELPEIARDLGISLATARTHLAHIYQKTGQSSRAGLVHLARDIAPPA